MKTRVRDNPPCEKDCPDRNEHCHGKCARYREWRAEMDAVMEAENQKKQARGDVAGMARDRKDWLRGRGYKV